MPDNLNRIVAQRINEHTIRFQINRKMIDAPFDLRKRNGPFQLHDAAGETMRGENKKRDAAFFRKLSIQCVL